MPPKKQAIPKYQIYKYTVIRLLNEDDDEERLFECIPDRWFVDETKISCFWPPMSGKSFTVRAVNCEKPDDSWNVYSCMVISGGHLTYNIGFKIVKEKCNQAYNTSSADEQINAEKYRREHLVLALKSGNIEHIFAEPSSASKKQSVAKKDRNVKVSSKKADNGSIPDTCIESTVISTADIDLETNFDEQNIVATRQYQRENDLNAVCGDRHEVIAINGDSGIARPENTFNYIKTLTDTSSRAPPHSSAHSSKGYRSRSTSSDGLRSSRSGRSRSGRSDESRSGRSGGSSSVRSGRSSSAGSSSRRSRGTRSNESRSGRSNSRNSRPRSSFSGRSRSRSLSSRSNRLDRSKSKSDLSSCSSSKSKRFRSNSRSRTRTHQHRSHAASRKISPKPATPDRMNNRHRSSERERHSKRSRIRSPEKSRPAIVERQSNLEQSSASIPESSHRRDVGTNHRPTNKNLPQAESIGGKNSLTKNKLTADSTVHDLLKVIQKMSATIEQNSQQLRRLLKMEVTVNKTFVLVGDLNGNGDKLQDELLNEQGFEIPQLPIESTKELTVMKRKLKNEEFRAFFLRHERDFCCPTKRSTDTSTISKYLMRYISLRVRSKPTLKENGENGITLFKDYRQIYLFLIDVMKAGYKNAKRTIAVDDAHTALRIVWGRSKQQYRESQRKSKPKRK